MGQKCSLTDFEKEQINALKTEGWNNSELSIKVKTTRKVIANYLKNPDAYGHKNCWDGPQN